MKFASRLHWKRFEDEVRKLASMKWGRPALPRTINGVRCDAVLEVEVDYWILIEISKEKRLEKLRTDLAKFSSVRPYLQSKGVYTKCYFVTEDMPTDMFVQTAYGQRVTALGTEELMRTMFDFWAYSTARASRQFGSAVDPFTGEKDDTEYVPVTYYSESRNRDLTLADIVNLLVTRHRIVLLGEYGTGKSRCHKQLFHHLQEKAFDRLLFPVSIDLRDMWGCRRAEELIGRHFHDLGLSNLVDMAVQIYGADGLCFLLDGFDEISSQAWSDDPSRLRQIRRDALAGVGHLISSHSNPVIVSGREHYFNDDCEMLNALGLNSRDTEIIRCKDSFSDTEALSFLARLDVPIDKLPPWLPRRPLILQTFTHLTEDERAAVATTEGAEVEFCHSLIDVICRREARIRSILDADTIQRILQRIARVVRRKGNYSAAVSIGEINRAFEDVVGTSPVDESAVMLQRLPALGRISAESNDRRFVDLFLLDGLLGLDVVDLVRNPQEEVYRERWINPARELAQSIIAQSAIGAEELYVGVGFKCIKGGNIVLAMDLISSLLLFRDEPVDLRGNSIDGAHVFSVDMSSAVLRNGSLLESVLERLVLPSGYVANFTIERCDIGSVFGVSSELGLPDWVRNCRIGNFDSVSTISRIRRSALTDSQIMFVSIIKKTFFQPGSGRKELALIRGMGDATASQYADRVLNLLLREGILRRKKGQEGWVYIPERKHMRRMGEIMAKLGLSRDPLWRGITELGR